MSRPDLDRMLEKAVAEVLSVRDRSRPVKRAYKPRSPTSFQPVHLQHRVRELRHA